MRLLIKHKVNTSKTRSPLYGHLSDSSFHVLVRLDLLYTNITSKHTSRHKKRKFQKSRILRPAHFTEELLVITYYIFSRIKESRNQGIKESKITPQTSTDQAQLLHSSTPRHSVKNGTLIGILAAHTAENELRTFSIVFLKGKPPKNHDFCSLRKHRFFRISLQANSVSCTTRRDLAHPREKNDENVKIHRVKTTKILHII